MSSLLLSSPHCKLHFKPRSFPNPSKKFKPFHLSTPSVPKRVTIVTNSLKTRTFPLQSLEPYVLSQHRSILLGWLCSAVSAFSLSQLVPRIGQFSSNLGGIELARLRNEGLLLGVLVAVKVVATYLQQALLWDAALGAIFKVRLDVFGKVLERELGFFEGGNGVPAGDIAYRLTAEAADVADTLYSLLNTIVPSALQLSAMAMQMVTISPVLSLVSAMMIPCMALVIAHLGKKLRKISKKGHLSTAALSAYLNEVFPAILFVKANNAEVSECARYEKLAARDLSVYLEKRKMKALIPQIIQAVYMGALLIFCVSSVLVSRGSFDGSSMVSFITSLVLLIEPIQDIGKAYNELKQGEPAIERLCDLSNFKAKVLERPDAIKLDDLAGDVQFNDVSFKYGDNTPLVLDGLNLHIRAGETIALAGPSGGGKTTLAKLLLRLYDPSAGYISIDNVNIENIRLEDLRRHICMVSQEIALFSGTVAENIGYRDIMTKIDMDRVEHAGRLANADEFIKLLPQGYKTNIGPRGSILSGGQKQRLAIARAVYQNPSVLILDEATSALDSRSELLVRQALQRLMQNRTVLVIAHRLETVLTAQRIFLVNEGRLKEVARSSLVNGGTAETLVSSGLVI